MTGAASTSFLPTAAATTTPAGTVVPLANARYILKGQYFDPVKAADTPLPPHQFFLFNVAPGPLLPIFGETSDASGISWIQFEDDLRFSTAGGVWGLGWRPLLRQPAGTRAPDASTMSLMEVFLDLDAGDWVAPTDVTFVDQRRLMRLPLWGSPHKATVGGFVDSPTSTSFGKSGKLVCDSGECTGYGSLNAPWLVQIDHKLFRNYVRFHYYNFKDKARKPLGRGVVASALGVRRLSVGPIRGDARGRVAAGTAIDGDGTIYLLHERTEAGSNTVDYYFSTGTRGTADHGVVVFSDPPDAQTHVVATNPSDKLDERYVLPQEWHSFGMQAYTEDASAGVGARKAVADVRLKGTDKTKPLTFHLDDAVVATNATDLAPTRRGDRIAIFDHLLHIRDEDPQKPHLWKTKLDANYLPAEAAVYVDGSGVEQLTRLVYRDGAFYDLREKRLTVASKDRLGVQSGVGARIAMQNDPDGRAMVSYMAGTLPNAPNTGHGEYHVIDTSYLAQPFPAAGGGTVSLKLMHLLVYLPVKIVPQSGASLAAVNSEVVPALTLAAERWDQKHPAHPSAPPSDQFPMEFVVVPVGTVSAGDKGLRIRHYFGEGGSRTDSVNLNIGSPGGRGVSSGNGISLYLGDTGPSQDTRFLEEDAQNVSTARFTLAHELGHQLGQPDEYDEDAADGFPIMKENVTITGYPPYDYPVEGVTARPYAVERPAMMKGNNQPRLRHYWVYVNRLRQEATFRTMLDNKDYVAADYASVASSVLTSDLRALPAAVLPNEQNHNPWNPIAPGAALAGARADIAVYRLAQDIGTVKRMFAGAAGMGQPLSTSERFDALALVYIRLLFDFDSTFDNPRIRSQIYTKVRSWCMQDSIPAPVAGTAMRTNYRMPFCIVAPAPPAPPPPAPPATAPAPLSSSPWRAAVAFSPQFDRKSRTPTPTGQHLTIRLVPSHPGGHPLLVPTTATTLTMTPGELGASVLCYALGGSPTDATGALKTAVAMTDLANVQQAVATALGSPTPATVVPFP